MSAALQLGFQYFLEHSGDGGNGTGFPVCEEAIDHYLFYQYSLIPAVVICVLFAATKTRRQILLNKLKGRPGLIFPMDTLTRATSFSYACAFGVTISVVYKILIDQQFAVRYTGPIALQTLIAIVSMFIYGMVFFPVFAALALASAFSYGLGTLYVWMFFIVECYKSSECSYTRGGRALIILKSLPSLLCLAYLSVSLPIRFVASCRERNFFGSCLEEKPRLETLGEIRESYQGIHVRDLLRKPVKKPEPLGKLNVIKGFLRHTVHRYIYHRKRGFEFPSRLVSVMFVAGCIVYVTTIEFLVLFVPPFNNIMDSFSGELDQIGWSARPDDTSDIVRSRGAYIFLYYCMNVLKVSTIVAITLSGVISILTILHMMTSYRKNLFAMYRGDFRIIPAPSENTAMGLCVGSIKYAGYQVAYIFWAYVISCAVLFIFCLIFAVIIILLKAGVTSWLVDTVLQIWPGVVMAIILYVGQMLLAKYFFLQEGQYLRLDNRRFYFLFAYFMFFFNIFMGLISCLMRIIKAIGIGIIFLARLDSSTLPRKFEFFDPGFGAYQGYIHMEAAHTHPVVNVFIRLLTSMSKARRQEKQKVAVVDVEVDMAPRDQGLKLGLFNLAKQKSSKYRAVVYKPLNVSARFNWYLTYTLLHNPMIRLYRKGYIQALKKARQEGIKLPISDKLFTEFDLIKTKEQQERDKIEELKKIQEDRRREEEMAAATLQAQGIPEGYELITRVSKNGDHVVTSVAEGDTSNVRSSLV